MSNAWVIYPWVGDNFAKAELIPHEPEVVGDFRESFRVPKEEPASD